MYSGVTEKYNFLEKKQWENLQECDKFINSVDEKRKNTIF